MALTPQQIQQFNQATGGNVNPNITPEQTQQVKSSQSRIDELSNIAKGSQTQNASSTPQPNSLDAFKQSAGGKAASFLTSSEQGVAQNVGATKTSFTTDQAQQMSDNAKQLIAHANTITDPARKAQILKIAQDISNTASGQANEQVNSIPSNLKAILDIVGVGADVLGAGTYGKATEAMKAGELATKAPTIVTAGEKVVNAVKNVGENIAESQGKKAAQKITDKIVEAVSPKLTAKETANAVAQRGTTKTGILGKIKTVVDPYTKKIADTVKQFVPDFNPSKTLSENINVTKEAATKMAQDLKSKVVAAGDGLVPVKELTSKLNEIGKGTDYIGLRGTQFEKQLPSLKQAAIDMYNAGKGKVSGLFDARKAFDSLVEKTYPNLYDKEYTPIRQAVAAIRNTMTDLTEKYLPEGVGLRDSLTHQSHLLSAIENMSEKAASGAQKEVGTNVVQRGVAAIKRHPIASGAATAVGADVVLRKLGL